jgi:hypothetical protein
MATAVMIDKVELRIPHGTPFTGPFGRLYRDLSKDPRGPLRRSQHYMTVADLRSFGHPVILHTHNLHDRQGNHKLELVETGSMTYSRMSHEIERVFLVRTNRDWLELMRLDMAADITGVPVTWFERNIAAKWKRSVASIGVLSHEVEFSELGTKSVQTFYLGKRPNLFRIYDKVAERRKRYALLKFRAKREDTLAALLSFEEMFGHADSGLTLTRVERQMGGGKIPDSISTFLKLRGAGYFNPFEALRFVGVGRPTPDPGSYDLPTYCTGMYLREFAERYGVHRLKQWLNERSKRNANRIIERFKDFLPEDGCLINSEGLFEIYRSSVMKQLAN